MVIAVGLGSYKRAYAKAGVDVEGCLINLLKKRCGDHADICPADDEGLGYDDALGNINGHPEVLLEIVNGLLRSKREEAGT